jgi:predicted Zn finger-like uncharacterized protein
MAIQVQCGACGAKYNVADAMAGKRVRCRQCGAVFGVPGAASAQPEGARGSSEDADIFGVAENVGENPGTSPPPPAKQGARPAPRRPNVLPPVSRMPGEEVDEEEEGAEAKSGDVDAEGYDLNSGEPAYVGFAANPAFQFSGAELIDRFGPHVIGFGMLGWMIVKTLRADDSGRPWLGYVRVALYIGVYAAIVFPLALWGVRRAGSRARFGMPPSHRWMVFAIFIVPFALGIIFSLTGEGLANFIIGVAIGLIPALAGLWFHCRLRPQQMATGLGTPAAFFIGGVALAVLLGVAANWAVQSSARSSPPNPPFTSSPLGPAFSWEATPAGPMHGDGHPSSPQMARIDQRADGAAGTQPVTQEGSTPPSTTTTTTSSEPPAVVATTPGAETTKPATAVAMATTTPSTAHEVTTPITVPQPQPQPQPQALSSGSPLVAGVSSGADVGVGEFEGIRFAGSAGMLVIRSRGMVADTLEVWSATPPFAKKATLSPPHPRDTRSDYFLSPKGTMVARMVEFPKRALELRNVADDKVKLIDLDAKTGPAEIVGFAASNQLLVMHEGGDACTVEPVDVNLGQKLRPILLNKFERGPGNLAISPDGKFLAAATRAADPAIQVIDIAGPRTGGRTYPVPALSADKPVSFSAISFTADSSRFCAFYEEADNGLKELFVTFKPPESRQVDQHLIFAERANPVSAAQYMGRALDWMPDGIAWLVYGNTVVEGDHVLGDLGLSQAKGHFIVDREMIALVVPSGPAEGSGAGGGKYQLVLVKLNLEKLNSIETTKATTRGKP